ncbi:MAG: helix-turn-helix domain-containing protein [Alphaproteobacteria bacterium]|nr:helix-turn-helix domain-containing protein [Alphaproteobacteria bacterium]
MSLFFDAGWFDARLAALSLSRSDLATALGLSPSELEELFKDQRELKAADVRMLAALLGTSPVEIAERAGISTPVPRAEAEDSGFAERLKRIEDELADLKREIAALRAARCQG